MSLHLKDVRLNLLIDLFSTVNRNLIDLIRRLSSKTEKHSEEYHKVLRLLAELKYATSGWASRYLPEIYREEDLKQLSLNSLKIDELNSNLVEDIISKMKSDIDKALVSVRSVASKAHRDSVEIDKMSSLVSVVGQTGRSYRFMLDYYVGLVAHNAVQNTRIAAVLERSRMLQNDLIRVSPNLSNCESICSAYANKVYSISGKSKIYPALSSIPPMPFHPLCSCTLDLHLEKETSNG